MDDLASLFGAKPKPEYLKSNVDLATPADRARARSLPPAPSLWESIADAPRYYLGPTGIPERLGGASQIAAMMSPGADMMDAASASGDIMRARSPMEAATAGAAMVGALGSMFIPGSVNRMAEGLTKFGADESGALKLINAGDSAAERGAQIVDMLKSGRSADVTDEMLDLGDAAANARLSEYLFRNYDLPMDATSRAERANGMGIDTELPLYHSTSSDFQAFRSEGMNDRARRWNFVSENPDFAAQYATANAAKHGKDSVSTLPLRANLGTTLDAGDARSVVDIFAKNTGAEASIVDDIRRGLDEKWPMSQFSDLIPAPPEYPSDAYTKWANLRDKINDIGHGGLGKAGADYWETIEKSTIPEQWGADSFVTRERKLADRSMGAMEDARNYGIQNPANIRSQFARFDPRLAHLRNLSAGVGGLGLASMFMPPSEEQQ